MRYAFACVLLVCLTSAAQEVTTPSRPAGDRSSADLVSELLAMPTDGQVNPLDLKRYIDRRAAILREIAAREDAVALLVSKLLTELPDMGRRAQLYRDVGAVGDPAIPVILKARPDAASRTQKNQLATALATVKTPAGTKALLALLPDPDDEFRTAAIQGLTVSIIRHENDGDSDQVFSALIKQAPLEKFENSRSRICMVMLYLAGKVAPGARNTDPLAVSAVGMLRGRLKDDESSQVRFEAACALAEFYDFSGKEELKKAIPAMHSLAGPALGRAVSAIEKISGKTFGLVPLDPILASDTRAIPALRDQRQALLDKLAEWAREDTAASETDGK
jgi:HEAT repeat protein